MSCDAALPSRADVQRELADLRERLAAAEHHRDMACRERNLANARAEGVKRCVQVENELKQSAKRQRDRAEAERDAARADAAYWRSCVALIAQGPCRCSPPTDPPAPPDCESCFARSHLERAGTKPSGGTP